MPSIGGNGRWHMLDIISLGIMTGFGLHIIASLFGFTIREIIKFFKHH